MSDTRRNLRSWRNKRTAAKARDTAAYKRGETVQCWLCKQPIDMTLPYHDAFAWSLDHIESLATGGHVLGQTLPAHRSCNSSRGDGTRVNPLQGQTRQW